MYNTLFVGFGAIAYGLGLDSKYVAENPIPSHFTAVKNTGMGVVTCAVEPSVKRASEARGAGVKRVAATVKDLPNLDEIKVVSFLAGPDTDKVAILKALPNLAGAVFEKPIGGDPAQIIALTRVLSDSNITAQVCYPRRFDRSMIDLRQEIHEGCLGDVQTVSVIYGNGVKNNGSHLIDLVRYLLGELRLIGPVREHSYDHALKDDVNVNFCLLTEAGASVNFQCIDFREYRENSIDIWGTKGRVLLAQEGSSLFRWEVTPSRFGMGLMEIDSATPSIEKTCLGTALSEVYSNLYGALQGREKIISTMENALTTESLIHEITQAAGH